MMRNVQERDGRYIQPELDIGPAPVKETNAQNHSEMIAMLRSYGSTRLNYGHLNLGDAAADVIEDQTNFTRSLMDFLKSKDLWDEYCTGRKD